MNPYVLPSIVAGVIALGASIVRLLSVILIAVPANPPSYETLPMYVFAGRFSVFVLVYGLLFGLAYWVGTQHDDASLDGRLALVTGAVAALGFLVGTIAIRRMVDVGHERWLFDAISVVGPSGSIGVQLAVVTFAGVSLARRRR